MKLGLLLPLFVILALSSTPSQSQDQSVTTAKTYTSPDGVFQFSYSADLVLCHPDPSQPDLWQPGKACNGSVPTCSDGGRNQTGVLACMGFKPGPAEKDTTYGGAAFSVADLGTMKNLDSCLQASPPQGSSGKWEKKNINGVEFQETDSGGGQGGQWSRGSVYRVLHNGRCYELNTIITGANAHMPDTPIKEFDEKPVRRAIWLPIWTFRFLK